MKAKMKTVKIHLLNISTVFFQAIDGKFGHCVLKPEYRKWWRCITYSTLVILTFIYIIIPLMKIWTAFVSFLNWCRWGM